MINRNNIILGVIILFSLFIRVWNLNSVPVSLFGDELDVGYQAYSIFKTGKDYSGNLLPFDFKSLAEWRTPLYLYSSVPTVAIFGISPYGVRLPAAIFGTLGVFFLFLLTKILTNNINISLITAFLLAVSPWHIQYSRAGFEVSEMLALLFASCYFFIKSFKSNNNLYISAFLFGLVPWTYNTAKLFVPLIIIVMVVIWFQELKKIPTKKLAISVVLLLAVAMPYTLSTLFGGGMQRFDSISIFNNPTLVSEIGLERLRDLAIRSNNSSLQFSDRIFHNKFNSLANTFSSNYLQAFSFDFLFLKGDPIPRHSIGIGGFFKFQAIFLILGIIYFIKKDLNIKIKTFCILWLIISPIPSALTSGGGNHATRLILMLPPLILLISYGIYGLYYDVSFKYRKLYIFLISIIFLISFIFYSHNYWVHYPWDSERWWHAGFENAIKSTVKEGNQYNKIIVSRADEPTLLYFLAWSMYSPSDFQKKYPLPKEEIENYGIAYKLDQYYFGEQGVGIDLYQLKSRLPKDSLYLATFKEIKQNLIKEPERIPDGIKLIKSIAYPSGDPAFYLFSLESS